MPRIKVIINPSGGTFVEGETEATVRKAFRAAGVEAEITLVHPDDDLVAVSRSVADANSEIIVAGGGDGTVSAVASVATDNGKKLGILPLGTLNHFARDLHIPADIEQAAAVIAAGYSRRIDICRVNERTFVNNSSIGLYPRIVRKRDVQQERLGRGKWSAALFAAIQVLKRHALFRVRLNTSDLNLVRKTPFVFVGNNSYQMDLYNIGKRDNLDRGEMSVYFLHKGGRWGVFLLALKTLIGRLEHAEEFQELSTDSLKIETRKNTLLVAIDGEVAAMQTPLNYTIMPRVLEVIVPRPPTGDA